MLNIKSFLITVLGIFILINPTFAQAADSETQTEAKKLISEQNVINQQLDEMTKALSKAAAQPSFRGFLRSEIAKSKNKENILDLDKFLDRAKGRQDAPPGLAKLHDSTKKTKEKLKSSGIWKLEGLDLYMPVQEHKTKWKGNNDLFVAFAPVNDEEQVSAIIAYSVKTGEQFLLDPNVPVETPVLIIAPEEHESHGIAPKPKMPATVPDDPKKHLKTSKPFTDKKANGNSHFHIKYLKIYDDREPWYWGDPEIYVFFGQVKYDNSCVTSRKNLTYVNDTYTWYTTYSTLDNFFDSTYREKSYARIMEYDGGTSETLLVNFLGYGVVCTFNPGKDDDLIATGWVYKNLVPFDRDNYQYLYNAAVYWYKRH